MKRKEKILYVVLAVLFIVYVIVEQYAPEELSWVPSYAQNDKNPYGAYVLYDRLEDFFDEQRLEFKTMYELADSSGHIISLSTSFEPSAQDLDAMFRILDSGRDILIGADHFSKDFMDTLGLSAIMDLENTGPVSVDSIQVNLSGTLVYYPQSILAGHFILSDTSDWSVLARHSKPILIQKLMGKGTLILSSSPLAFTNYGILRDRGYLLAEHALQHVSWGSVIYNRYYHSGRGESNSPFRYLMSQNPLRWSVYLTLLGILLILIVGSRRKQRMIPVLDPKINSTVKFVKTIGALYHREANHKGAAEKLINHFLKSLTEKYYMSELFTEASYAMLAVKNGLKKEHIIQTFDIIRYVRSGGQVSEAMLNELNQKITAFKLKH